MEFMTQNVSKQKITTTNSFNRSKRQKTTFYEFTINTSSPTAIRYCYQPSH